MVQLKLDVLIKTNRCVSSADEDFYLFKQPELESGFTVSTVLQLLVLWVCNRTLSLFPKIIHYYTTFQGSKTCFVSCLLQSKSGMEAKEEMILTRTPSSYRPHVHVRSFDCKMKVRMPGITRNPCRERTWQIPQRKTLVGKK